MRLLQAARKRPKDRVQTETDKAAGAKPAKFPAPTMGWVENENIAEGSPKTARVLENAFPTLQGVRVRGGATQAATIGARIISMFSYQTASTSKMFATSASAIYDVTGLNPTTPPAASVSSLTSGYFSTAQLGTVAGEYMYAVNGTDSARLYDGSTWTTITGVSTPAITGVTTSTLSYVWVHKNRFWFVKKGTKKAWYLPVDSIGGAAGEFSLDGVFQRGGALLFGATWSQDAGDGMDDRAVFVSTEGEVAVYQGTDPSSAADWAMVGLYNITKPRGMKCHLRAGGDLIIGTDAGIVPLSAVTTKDPAALDTSAVTAAIEPSWRNQVTKWDSVQPWELHKWPRENLMLVTLPHSMTQCYVANLQSGAWGKYVGWDVQSATLFNNILYFGNKAGDIFAAETGGTDDGIAYVTRISYMPTDFGDATAFKSASAMRGTFLAANVTAQLSVSPDYGVTFPALPEASAAPANTPALWGVALWGVALWGDDGQGNLTVRASYSTGWTAIGARGFSMAPQVQIVNSGAGRPAIELISIDVLLETGGALV